MIQCQMKLCRRCGRLLRVLIVPGMTPAETCTTGNDCGRAELGRQDSNL